MGIPFVTGTALDESNVRKALNRVMESCSRNQTQPTAKQLQRIGALLDSATSRMPEETAKMLRFSIKPP